MYTTAVLCATQRGYRFLKRFSELAPKVRLLVFSFQEEPWEPPFLEHIKKLTNELGGQFFEGKKLGSQKWMTFWESTTIDLMLMVNWRYMLPKTVYSRPRLGTYVFHDSLLPEYRGFSPTMWAILNGEDHTGVTLFEIAEEVDSGDIIDQKKIPVGPDDTIATVTELVTNAYLYILEKNIEGLLTGKSPRISQYPAKATFTCKRLPSDNLINWSSSTLEIYNLIRAVTQPYPGAYSFLNGKRLRIWGAKQILNGNKYVGRIPGRVVEVKPGVGSVVLTGNDALMLTQVQLEDGDIVNASEVINSLSQTLGS
jgi:methionyl-tRNA formyltransferase